MGRFDVGPFGGSERALVLHYLIVEANRTTGGDFGNLRLTGLPNSARYCAFTCMPMRTTIAASIRLFTILAG